MPEQPGVRVTMKNTSVNDSIVGAGTAYMDSTHSQGNLHVGDDISGPGAIKVGGSVGNINNASGNLHHGDNINGPMAGWKVQGDVNQPNVASVPDNQSQAQAPTSSEIRSSSRNTQTSRGEAVPPTRDFENFVYTIFNGHPEEDKKNIVTCLGNIGIYKVEEIEIATVNELVDAGIKLVQAKLLLRHYKDHLPESNETKASVKETGDNKPPTKAKRNAVGKRIPTQK